MKMMRSNLWPVFAYLTAIIWLIMVGINKLGGHAPPEYFQALSQLDSTAHFMVVLSISSIGVQVLGKRKTFALVIGLIVVWEIFEVFTQPLLAGPSLRFDATYLMDTMDDLVMGLAGMLVGVYLEAKPLNTAKDLGKVYEHD